MTSFDLNYRLKALSPDTLTLGVRASVYEPGGLHQLVCSNIIILHPMTTHLGLKQYILNFS